MMVVVKWYVNIIIIDGNEEWYTMLLMTLGVGHRRWSGGRQHYWNEHRCAMSCCDTDRSDEEPTPQSIRRCVDFGPLNGVDQPPVQWI